MRSHRWAVTILLCAAGGLAAIWAFWRSAPQTNTTLQHFDVILVLGTPSELDGSISDGQRERVLEGIREWKRGRAPRLIMSGGAAHNQWAEAHTMALFAEQQGVPAEDVLEEGRSMNTIQNVYYTDEIMQAHGWHSADVVSEWSHLPRAALILSHHRLLWRTDAAPWPRSFSAYERVRREWREAVYYAYLRIHGLPRSRFVDHPLDTSAAQNTARLRSSLK